MKFLIRKSQIRFLKLFKKIDMCCWIIIKILRQKDFNEKEFANKKTDKNKGLWKFYIGWKEYQNQITVEYCSGVGKRYKVIVLSFRKEERYSFTRTYSIGRVYHTNDKGFQLCKMSAANEVLIGWLIHGRKSLGVGTDRLQHSF